MRLMALLLLALSACAGATTRADQVFVINFGQYFHRESHLTHPDAHVIDVQVATSRGYAACPECRPLAERITSSYRSYLDERAAGDWGRGMGPGHMPVAYAPDIEYDPVTKRFRDRATKRFASNEAARQAGVTADPRQ